MDEVFTVPLQGSIPAHLKSDLIKVMMPYYQDVEKVLEKEIKYGDRLFYTKLSDTDEVGAFLIVNHAHLTFSFGGNTYRCSYGGQGCAKKQSILPLFFKTKIELQKSLKPNEKGLIYLTTASPYVFRGLITAFATDIYPTIDNAQNEKVKDIATYLSTEVFSRKTSPQESPFVLRGFSTSRYSAVESSRHKAVQGLTPPRFFGIDHKKGDRLITFYVFSNADEGITLGAGRFIGPWGK